MINSTPSSAALWIKKEGKKRKRVAAVCLLVSKSTDALSPAQWGPQALVSSYTNLPRFIHDNEKDDGGGNDDDDDDDGGGDFGHTLSIMTSKFLVKIAGRNFEQRPN